MQNTYQYNFSKSHPVVFNISEREQKANKIISILSDYFGTSLNHLNLLDVGSSIGIMTFLLSKHFNQTIGIDIDENGVKYAEEHFKNDNLLYQIGDSMNLSFPDNHFDVVNCAQVYEHVPDSKKLMSEIYRVLKPGGICFFSAGNRFILIEDHYKLPFLSAIPKKLANIYLRLLGRGTYYYETHLSYWGLKKITSDFQLIDYTKKVIEYPERYSATEMIKPNSLKQKIILIFLDYLYWLCPTYIWILKKQKTDQV
jgi:ubiquinone/menaquinone biosynthesis C-methylase UbiE